MRAGPTSPDALDSTDSLVEGRRYHGQVIDVDMTLERLETDRPMLARTRYAAHFRMVGDTAKHFSLFDCAPVGSFSNAAAGGPSC